MAADSEAGYHAIEQGFGSDRLKLIYSLLDDLAATRIAKDTYGCQRSTDPGGMAVTAPLDGIRVI